MSSVRTIEIVNINAALGGIEVSFRLLGGTGSARLWCRRDSWSNNSKVLQVVRTSRGRLGEDGWIRGLPAQDICIALVKSNATIGDRLVVYGECVALAAPLQEFTERVWAD